MIWLTLETRYSIFWYISMFDSFDLIWAVINFSPFAISVKICTYTFFSSLPCVYDVSWSLGIAPYTWIDWSSQGVNRRSICKKMHMFENTPRYIPTSHTCILNSFFGRSQDDTDTDCHKALRSHWNVSMNIFLPCDLDLWPMTLTY